MRAARDTARFAEILRQARELIEEERFLHWQVAFPGIWSDWEAEGLTGGFDAIVGNPPWDRIKLQQDISHTNEVLAETPRGGIAHWHVEYQVASEELFEIWAKSTGTGLPARAPGDPLPRMILDGTLVGEFDHRGRATNVRIWWHSTAQPG